MSFNIADHGLRVRVEGGCVRLDMDVETAEWIVSELPATDEVTRLIARGVVALALEPCPTASRITGVKI